MAEWRLVAVGRMGRGPEAELFARYRSRLRPSPVLTEIAEARGPSADIPKREAAAILAAVPDRARLVALDLGGVAPGSEALAREWTAWRESGTGLCFAIGGAEGLHAGVLARADQILSLGPLTWPHMLVRIMLMEQLFRAQCIATGHPYHRAGRP